MKSQTLSSVDGKLLLPIIFSRRKYLGTREIVPQGTITELH
jgi:hypothetical protein